MHQLALPWLVLVFAAAAAVIWVSGIALSTTVDVLDERLHLGSALGGTLLLAIVTNLPELAITVSAALQHNLGIAVGNILGGIAIQTVVLVVLDAFGTPRNRSLTYLAANLGLVLEAALVIAVLVVTVMGTQLPAHVYYARMTPAAVLVVALWIGGLVLVSRARAGLPWQAAGEAPDNQDKPRGHAQVLKEQRAAQRGMSTVRAAVLFGVAAGSTLVAGVVLERSGEAAAGHLHLTGVLFGATVLAAATSLPEVSTGLTSSRMGDYQLAMSDIFGGNAFLPVLFVVADVLSGRAVLPQAQHADIYLTGLGALLTSVYVTGLIVRPQRTRRGLGLDSIAVLVLYAVGIVGLALLPSS